MMVWMWYDCMTSVWWCDSFVCECCECIQIEEIARNVKQKIDWKNHKKYRLCLSFFVTFPPIPRHGGSLKIYEDSRKTSSVVIWFAFVYPCVSTEDPEEQKCYFLYYHIKEIYNRNIFLHIPYSSLKSTVTHCIVETIPVSNASASQFITDLILTSEEDSNR